MSWRQDVEFDGRTIDDFCTATGDTNNVHRSAFMHQRGRYSIVPGMLTLSKVLQLAEKEAGGVPADKQLTLEAQFTSPLRENEAIRMMASGLRPNESIGLYANAGKGCALNSEGKNSKLVFSDYEGTSLSVTGREFSLQRELYGLFIETIGAKDTPFMRLAYAIACSSSAVIQTIADPRETAEKQLQERMAKEILPVYSSVKVIKQTRAPFENLEGVGYFTHLEFDGDRTVKANTLVAREGKELFMVSADLSLWPEKAIIGRFATKLPAGYNS